MVTEIKEGGRRVESEKKVFPGYVLVRMELDDPTSWALCANTPGVTGFVGADGNPAPLTTRGVQQDHGPHRQGEGRQEERRVLEP